MEEVRVSPLAFGDTISIGSLVVAALALIGSMLKNHKADAALEQYMKDKLEAISGLARETRDSTKEIERKIDDHSTRIARAEERIDTLFKRVGRLEDKADIYQKIGGND